MNNSSIYNAQIFQAGDFTVLNPDVSIVSYSLHNHVIRKDNKDFYSYGESVTKFLNASTTPKMTLGNMSELQVNCTSNC